MPRRPAIRATTTDETPSIVISTIDPVVENLKILGTHWKWAAFSQFFFTFAPLFAMNDVSLNDVEDDLARGSSLVLPRIMQRLLFILTYDRKISLDSWQSYLRKQYYKRNPFANPIGPDPNDALMGLFSSMNTTSTTPDPTSEQKIKAETPDPSRDEMTRHGTPAHSSTREASLVNDEIKGEQSLDEDFYEAQPKKKKIHLLVTDEEAIELAKQESRNWLQLTLMEKLDSLHLVTEWLFQNPTRVRFMMKIGDDDPSWRIEPIGYDSKRNAYWFIGPDRLWIQREPPKPPRAKKSLKRRREEKKSSTSKGKAAPSKRRRLQSSKDEKSEKVTIKIPRKGADTDTVNGKGRAAKAQAKLKLDAQAKELAELNRQAALLAKSEILRKRGGKSHPIASRSAGTRVSARLRGAQDDEEWQVVPDEWLHDEDSDHLHKKDNAKTGLESDDDAISELTELSEDSEVEIEELKAQASDEEVINDDDEAEEAEEPRADPDLEAPALPEGFIEWEMICHTLYEWEHILERWENATHYSEKALYKYLKNNIVPIVTEELREIERKRKLEEAIVHRKRSSRIAVKESEKEEARLLAKRKAEEEEKLSRARRAEARQLKEEADRQRREMAREERRREREAKEAEEKAKAEQVAQEQNISSTTQSRVHAPSTPQKGKAHNGAYAASGTRTPKGEEWELDCEVCYRRGMNVDDGVPIMCCEGCSKWHHIPCHDRADELSGKSKRDWEKVDFVCRQCQLKRLLSRSGNYQPAQHNPYLRLPLSHTASQNSYMSGPTSYSATPAMLQSCPSPSVTQSSSSYSVPKAITFSHYEPQRRGFSTATASSTASTLTQSYGQLAAAAGHYPQNNAIPSPQYPKPVAGSGWSNISSTDAKTYTDARTSLQSQWPGQPVQSTPTNYSTYAYQQTPYQTPTS